MEVRLNDPNVHLAAASANPQAHKACLEILVAIGWWSEHFIATFSINLLGNLLYAVNYLNLGRHPVLWFC